MSKNKRGSRGSKVKDAVVLNIRDEAQLERTLSLSGIVGEKPSINGIMPVIEKRLDAEYRKANLALARKWQRECGFGRQMLYECMGEDFPGFDDEEYFSRKGKKYKNIKKGKKGRKRYNYYEDEDDYWKNRDTMFTHGEWSDDDENNYEPVGKVIKFYPSIDDENTVIEFNSLKGFSDYCDEQGYKIGSVDYNNLVNWDVIHCCLDPISLEYGESEIITDNSYGGLYWTVDGDMAKYGSHSNIDYRTYTD